MIHFFSPLVQPVGLVWLALIAIALWLARRKERRGALAVALVAFVMTLVGGDWIGHPLLAGLEKPYARGGLNEAPPADAVVMLGGAHRASPHDAFGLDLTAAGDRVVTAVELVRLGKAPVLVLGGNGYMQAGVVKSDAALLREWLTKWKVLPTPALDLGINRNTREEAEKVKALMTEKGWQKILLVTSAFHMRRAEAVFRKLGIDVVPVACDFQSYNALGEAQKPADGGVFPHIEGFQHLGLYLHEQGGWWVYRWRGWLE